MEKILITGGSGRLGKYLVKQFDSPIMPSHSELDITDRNAVDSYIQKTKPDVIIHLAAWVDVRGCQNDHEKAWKVNVGGTENILEAVLKHCPNSYFIYISTACVFDGKRGGYTEADVPNPINFYGLTKLISEYIVKKVANHFIIRTDFVERAKWRYPGAYDDRFSTCVFSDTLSEAIAEHVKRKETGLLHLTGKRRVSHYELAQITTPEVKPIKLVDADIPMPRDQSLKSVKGGNYLELVY